MPTFDGVDAAWAATGSKRARRRSECGTPREPGLRGCAARDPDAGEYLRRGLRRHPNPASPFPIRLHRPFLGTPRPAPHRSGVPEPAGRVGQTAPRCGAPDRSLDAPSRLRLRTHCPPLPPAICARPPRSASEHASPPIDDRPTSAPARAGNGRAPPPARHRADCRRGGKRLGEGESLAFVYGASK